MPNYFDIHAHLNFSAFSEDGEKIIEDSLNEGVWMVNVGSQRDTSKKAVEIAASYDAGVYAAVGLHPIHTSKSFYDEEELGEGGENFTSRGEIFDYETYKEMAVNPKVVAIGECGLDFFRLEGGEEAKRRQVKAFERQIELSVETGKPLMIHCREAYKETLEILNSYKKEAGEKLKGDMHFFAGDWETAKKFLDLGFYLSFTGVITFAGSYNEVIKNMPLDRIMAETDSPYVAPVPHRGGRNQPSYVKYTVRRMAEIRGEDDVETGQALVKNSLGFFGLAVA